VPTVTAQAGLSSRSLQYGCAAASGVLLTLSFPSYGHPAFGWIALTPLVAALSTNTRSLPLGRAFLLGLVTGVVYFTGTLYWITRVMAVYGGLQGWVAVLVNAALIVYLALFPAVFAIATRRIVIAHGRPALMAAPLVWVATELGRTHILTGFPWVLLGYSQTTVLPIAQFASLFGVYGVSMLVASVSAALALVPSGPGPAKAVASPARAVAGPAKAEHYRGMEVGSRFTPALVVFTIVVAVAVWGSRRAAGAEWTRAGEAVRVGLIQGNVQQGQKWDPNLASTIFTGYLARSRQAIREGAELVLWPESAAPFMFNEDVSAADRVRALAREARVPILVGSDEIEWRVTDRGRVPDKFFNSAFLVRADGSTAGVYRKMHLVPFGEYVPFQKLLFFAAPLTEQVGTFAPGLDPALLPVNGHPISVAICYEVVYPDLVRQFVAGGSEMLTTITNDAWFGPTSAPYQHFEQASMRAIEEGRYMVRAANTGISGIVDPYGRVLERTDIFQTAVLVGEARFLRTSTFYARHGDILAYASVVMTAALLLLARRVRRA